MLRGLRPRNQRSWMSAVADATGGATFEAGGVPCVHQPRAHGELIVAFPGQPPGAEILERAAELGVRRIGCWSAGPWETWPELDARMRELGFDRGWQPHWMTARSGLSEPDPRVMEVHDAPPEYDDYGQALVGLTRQKPQTSFLFVAREEDGRFAGHAWLHVAAHIGGLYDVFVPEDLRRRGLGSALSRAATAKAAQVGIDTVVLNAECTPLYESLGFRSSGYGQTWWRHLTRYRPCSREPERLRKSPLCD